MHVPGSHLGTEGRPIGWGDWEEAGVVMRPRQGSGQSRSAGSRAPSGHAPRRAPQMTDGSDDTRKACVDMGVTREVGATRPLGRGGVKVGVRGPGST